MRNKLTLGLIVSTLTTSVFASPVMTKAQYADYSVLYRCAEQKFHDDLEKKEAELIRIEDKFGLTDDNFDEFDELVTLYEKDDKYLEKISLRAQVECN